MKKSITFFPSSLILFDKRGDTLADYFEQVQWKVSFADVRPTGTDMLGPTLPVQTSQFTLEEHREALKALAVDKAAGCDDIPPEFWKVLLGSAGPMEELLQLCQTCWSSKDIPEQWRRANVVLLHKKGDASLPENYRPIALLPVGYKVLARMLHNRLQHGAAEARIRSTQFGFRHGWSTVQAIALARRMFDAAYSASSPGIVSLLLDWAKALDRVRTDSMLDALRRFGLPPEMLDMIAAIYRMRRFVLKDPKGDSSVRAQSAGIAQGCPLSPYLFILVQTVLLHDVDGRMKVQGRGHAEPEYIVSEDVLYADDTLLVSSNAAKLQRRLDTVVDEGKRYGLELNWGKTVLMKVGMAVATSKDHLASRCKLSSKQSIWAVCSPARPRRNLKSPEDWEKRLALSKLWRKVGRMQTYSAGARLRYTWPVLCPSCCAISTRRGCCRQTYKG